MFSAITEPNSFPNKNLDDISNHKLPEIYSDIIPIVFFNSVTVASVELTFFKLKLIKTRI